MAQRFMLARLVLAIVAWSALVVLGGYNAVKADPICPNAESMLPSLKAQGLKAEIIVGAKLDAYAHAAWTATGLIFTGSPRAVLMREPDAYYLAFEDAAGCLVPIPIEVPKMEYL